MRRRHARESRLRRRCAERCRGGARSCFRRPGTGPPASVRRPWGSPRPRRSSRVGRPKGRRCEAWRCASGRRTTEAVSVLRLARLAQGDSQADRDAGRRRRGDCEPARDPTAPQERDDVVRSPPPRRGSTRAAARAERARPWRTPELSRSRSARRAARGTPRTGSGAARRPRPRPGRARRARRRRSGRGRP